MTPQQLRNSILQQAIEGKLVEQRPEEGSAEELYAQIQKEKKKLIAEGKIKKEKPLPEITEDEIPFDIPESWKWVKLGSISSYAQTKSKVTSKLIDQEQWCLDLEDIEKETGKILIILKAKERQIKGDKNCFKKGDILYSKLRPYLKKILVAPDSGICSSEIVPFNTYFGTDNNYLVYVLKSAYIDCIVNSASYGVKMPRAGTDTMINLLIPLPPLTEQKRIVAKIEELLPFIDKYEKAYNALEEYNARFPEDMRKSILQQAIEGKLVEQRKEEGTAEELYAQIQEEKQKLIAEGKIKKEKPLPEITEDEIPFDIPESWKWVRLSDVIDVRDGTHDTPKYVSNGFPLITGKDFYYGYFDLEKTKYISEEDYKEIIKRSKVDVDDILFSMIGGNIGSMIIVTNDNYFDMAIKNVALFKQYDYKNSLAKYLLMFLKSQIYTMKAKAKGGAQSFVSLNMLRSYYFPLPPLEEQKRIVAKIEELLPYCDKLN